MSNASDNLVPTVPATARPIVPLLAYQARTVASTARFTWSNWSRQIGKSFAFALKRTKRAVETGRLQVLLSAGERQSRELMEKVRQHCQAMQLVAEYHEDTFFEGTSIKQLELRLPNKGRIIALPANPNTARGFTGDVFLDEFAMHQHDREIWAALLPTVMRGNGQLDVASTPKGKSNQFYRLAENESFERTTVTLLDAIAQGLDVNADEIRAAVDDDEIWRQEFLCEFVDEATAFLTFELIAGCEDSTIGLPMAIDGKHEEPVISALTAIAELDSAEELFAGYDVARKRDLAVLWIVGKLGEVLKTRLVVELNNVPFRAQTQILDAFLRHPAARGLAIDATGMGMPLAEELTERFGPWKVDAVNFAGSSEGQPVKEKLAGQLRVKVEDKNLRIPATQAIRNDWHSIEKSVTTGGRIRYHADRNKYGHADRFWAAALAVSAATDAEGSWDGTAYRIEGSSRYGTVSRIDQSGLRFARHGVW